LETNALGNEHYNFLAAQALLGVVGMVEAVTASRHIFTLKAIFPYTTARKHQN
jgi:hypothetical protein